MAVFRVKRFGMCPASGCIQKDPAGVWRVISNKTGKYWPAHYKSKDSAEKALSAYHASR
jgi:hypothetical protein